MRDERICEVGNVRVCRFAFAERDLSDAEQTQFLDGNGLPDGLGAAPGGAVFFDYRSPGGTTTTTLSSDSIVVDDPGEFHVLLPITQAGIWRWRGRALDGDGNPFAATLVRSFEARDGLDC